MINERDGRVLNVYITAGFPELGSLPGILNALEKEGVDMVEIGLPYSDPLSDGPTIQQSSSVAIKNGIKTDLIFEQLNSCNTNMPILMMGYFNSVYKYGVESFCRKCSEMGVEALIIPDLPLEMYLEDYKEIFDLYGLDMVFLVTPETAEERIRTIDQHSNSFIYAVSSSSTTGRNKNISEAESYLRRLKAMQLENPILVGFNIQDKEDLDFVSQYAAGGIIGSAFIRSIAQSKDLNSDISIFVKKLRNNDHPIR